MQAAEIELKFRVDDVQALRRAVENLDLQLQTDRTFESNTLYDTPDRAFRTRTEVLRLRNYGPRCVLTHKRVPEGATKQERYKTRIETETSVEDCAAMEEIFARLGLVAAFRYEKYRTEWYMEGEGHLVLDETPIGVWAELEGSPGWIESMLTKLGVRAELCTTESYGALFLAWKEATGSPAEHLTFQDAGMTTANY